MCVPDPLTVQTTFDQSLPAFPDDAVGSSTMLSQLLMEADVRKLAVGIMGAVGAVTVTDCAEE
jgi:hypothetical protein